MKLENLLLDQVGEPLNRVRRHKDQHIQSLVASIVRHGLICPPVLSQSRGAYRIILGSRRIAALRTLEEKGPCDLPVGFVSFDGEGLLRVTCVVMEEVSSSRARIMNFIDNEINKDLSPYEEARLYENLSRDHTEEEIADELMLKRSKVGNALDAMRVLPKEALSAWEEGRLSNAHVRQLRQVEDPGLRERLFKKTLEEDLPASQLSFLLHQSRNVEELSEREKLLHLLRARLAQDREIGLKMKTGQVRVVDSRKGDRISIDYGNPTELTEVLQKMVSLLT